MVLVLGVSAGSSGARAVLAHPDRPHHEPVARCDVRLRVGAALGEPMISAIRTLRTVAIERGEMVAATAVTLRTGLEPEVVQSLSAATTRQHVEVLPETAAQVRYLRFTGALPRHGTAVLYDVGSSGLSIAVADGATGEVLAARRSAMVCGDRIDQLLQEQLAAQGVWRGLSWCRDVKEQLAHERVVTATDPRTGAATVVTTGDLVDLSRADVIQSVSLLHTMIRETGTTPAVLVLLGGGAHLPGLRERLESLLRIPVSAAPDPTSVAGRGAVLLAAATAGPARWGPSRNDW
ncbi:hypothetical protein GCM10023094_11960 [Rhodococcus olei]|uniref:DUF7159 domain-containing protein n=1 Tax=Rhodococcus olei TaxID=2161675 RepID=A0ABP8NWQ7_9NOCA